MPVRRRARSSTRIFRSPALALPALLLALAACSRTAPDRPALRAATPGQKSLLSPVLSQDFEAGLGSWVANTTSGLCTWHTPDHPENLQVNKGPDARCGGSGLNPFCVRLPDPGNHLPAVSGTHVAWFGEDSTGTFLGSNYGNQTANNGGSGATVQTGTLTSPSFSLVGQAKALLEFDSWWEIEGVAGQSYDTMFVKVSGDDGATWQNLGELNPTFATAQPGNAGYTAGGPSAAPQWRHYAFDLTGKAGNGTVKVQFAFDSRDTAYNAFRGWSIDNVVASAGPSFPAPTLTSITPAVATTSDVVSIQGAGFLQGAVFTIGATTIASSSITQFGTDYLIFKTPALAAGTYSVKVTNPDGQSFTLPNSFTWVGTASPKVSSLSPAAGTVGTAQSVTITGLNFVAGSTVVVGSATATAVTVVSATSITATFPALQSGIYNVTVSSPNGQSGTKFSAYTVPTVVDDSTISLVAPNGGESWTTGTTQNITWTTTGTIANVAISLLKAGTTVATLTASTSAAANTFAWSIPAGTAPGNDYSVRIYNPMGSSSALSAAAFTIVQGSFTVAFQTDGTPLATLSGVASQAVSAGNSTTPVTANAPAAAYFVNWTGTGGFAPTTANPLTVTNVTAAMTITANFAAKAATTTALASSLAPSAYGDPVTFTATVSPAGATGSVQFQLDGVDFGGPVALAGGVATSAAVGSLSVGSHPVSAAYSGDATNLGSTDSLNQKVQPATPVISWPAPPPLTYGTPLAGQLNATASVAGSFVYSPAAGTVLNAGVGQTLRVDFTPADTTNYTTATTTVSIDVAPRPQTLSFAAQATFTYGAPDFTPGATSSAGLPVTYTSDTPAVATVVGGLIHLAGAGTATLTAAQAGDGNTLSASAQQVITVAPALLTVRAQDASRATGAANPAFAALYSGFVLGESASVLTGAPAFSTAAGSGSAAGSYPITAAAGTLAAANYTFAFADGTLAVGLASQTVTFNPLAPATWGDAPLTLVASGGASGNPVTFTSSDPAVATVSGSTLTIAGAGQTTLVASQAGDASHASASAQQVFTVQPAALLVTAQDASRAYGAADPAFSAVLSGFVNGDTAAVVSGAPSLTSATNASTPTGSYPITAAPGTLAAANYRFVFAGGTLGVGLASQSIVFDALPPLVYGAAPFAPSATGGASGAPVSFTSANSAVATVSGGLIALKGAGETLITASQPSDGTWAATTASRTLVVTRALVTVTAQDASRLYAQPDPAFAAAYLGFVYLEDASVLSGAPALVTATTPQTPVGTYPIRAGAGNLAAQNYLFQFVDGALTIGQSASNAVLTSSPAPSVFGEQVTFTATVGAAAGVPTGTVTFTEGGALLGSGALVSGVATLQTAALAVGSHDVVATYGGDANFTGSISTPDTQAVNKAPTAIALTPSSATSTFGDTVTLSAAVVVPAPGAGQPSGAVTFFDGAAVLGAALLDGSGLASLQVATLAAGTHALGASYAGDGSFAGAGAAAVSFPVSRAAVTVALGAAPALPVVGQPVTLSVSVSGPGGTPGGSVVLRDGSTALATVALDGAGAATFTTAALVLGAHALAADYGGADNYLAGAGSSSVTVGQASTTTALSTAPGASVFGQAVQFSATVVTSAPGSGIPSGMVAFKDFAVTLGAAALDPAGAASFSTAALAAGPHSITAVYLGVPSYGASTSGAVSQPVGKGQVTATAASSSAASVGSQPVTFTATLQIVAPAAGVTTGSVSFSEGGVALGSGAVSGGAASFTTSALAVGAHTIVAAYSGDGSFSAASATLVQTVALATAQVTAAITPPAPSYGQPLTISVTVARTAPATATPGGAFTVLDGATVLGTVTLDAGGLGSFTLSSLGAGPHSISIQYAGDAVFAAASTAVATSISIAKAVSAVALAATPTAAVSGQAASFAVTVTSPGGTPTGTVALADGATPLGVAVLSGGAGTVAVPRGFLVGLHALSASYAGDANFLSAATAPLALPVTQAATSLALDASANPLRVNRPVTFHAQVSATAPGAGVPTGAVAFSDGEQAIGAVVLDASGSAALTLASLPFGNHPISARYAGSTEFTASSGTLASGQTIEKSAPVAGSGTALSFDGHSQDVAIAGGALDAAAAVELWFERSANDVPGLPACLVQQGLGSAVRFGLCLSASRDGFELRRGGVRQPLQAAVGGGWHHVALVDEGGKTDLILDGMQVASLSGGFAPGAGLPVVLGAAPSKDGRTDFFTGNLDEVRFWSASPGAAALARDKMRPLAGDEANLLGLWRLDEGKGAEAYDSAPRHVVASLEGATTPAWIPSAAWRRRSTQEERALEPFEAGYDPDGAPLTLTISVAAKNGKASVSGGSLSGGAAVARGLIGYLPGKDFTGGDAFTYAVSNGSASSEFTTEVEVVHINSCKVQSDCGGGDVCVNQVCAAPASLSSVSGAQGCSSLPGDGSWPALVPLLLAAALAFRRRRTFPRAGRGRARAAAVLSVLVLGAAQARAAGFALETFQPSPVGDRFFAVPDADVPGSLSPTFGLQGGWAHQPLLLEAKGRPVANGLLVQDQMTLRLGAALSLLDRVLLDGDISMIAWQTGQAPFSGQGAISARAFSDPRLGARVALLRDDRLGLALGLSVWLPLGSQANFSSDATVRATPQLLASGRTGRIAYASEVAVDLRKHASVLYTQTGSGLRLALAGGYLFFNDKLQVGPELYSRVQFSGAASSSLEALLGARLQQGDFSYGVGVGARLLQDAPGAAPLRIVAQLTFNGFDLFRRSSRPPERLAAPRFFSAPAEPARYARVEPRLAAAPEVVTLVEGPVIDQGRLDLKTVQFEHDRAVLLPGSEAALESAAAALRAHPEVSPVFVAGYGDDHGSRAHNLKLTAARAAVVRAWFIEHDLAPARLRAAGCGSVQPIASNATEEGRAQNRRVELHVPAADGVEQGCVP